MRPAPVAEDLANEVRALDRAVRVGFLVFTGFCSYFAIRLSLSIDDFARIFLDMFAKPPSSIWIHAAIDGKPVWILLSFLLPAFALAFAVKARRASTAVYGISLSAALLLVQSIFLWTVLTAPIAQILGSLSSER
jgi:hypothetical protein